MKKFILLFFTCCCVLFCSAQESSTGLAKLNGGQKAHFRIFQKLQAERRKKDYNLDAVFKAYYVVIADACKKTAPKYSMQGEKIQEQADKALADGDEKKAKKLDEMAGLYIDLSQAQNDIVKAFQNFDTGAMSNAILNCQKLETTMRSKNIKMLERTWLYQAEAEKLARIAQKK